MPPTLSYCVVNTDGRELLLACLAAIERTHPAGVEAEVLVLDNASEDGSAEAVRALGGEIRLIALERRAGKAENDSTLMRAASGRCCLLLNEDSELRPGAAAALIEALDADPRAAAAGARLLGSDGEPVPCAWRFPGVGTALAGALFLHRLLTVQSSGSRTRRVDWTQSSALLVRREAAESVGYLDPAFFVYYDECDFAKRLADAGWHSLFVPAAEAVHHDQLSTDLAQGLPRIVEFHRNRDLYMRKHHGAAAALAVRALTAWSYAARALVATVLPNHPARVYRAHARQALLPGHGESIRDRAQPRSSQDRGSMRLPSAVHESAPWRIREIASDFTVEDVWALPVRGGAEDFQTLLELMAAADPANAESLPARALWRLRDRLGRWLDLGRISARAGSGSDAGSGRLPVPGTTETSLAGRLPDDLRDTATDLDFASLPFEPLYRTATEFAAEVSNRTVHGVMHLAWVDRGGGRYQGQMAVYVKPRGLFGKGYMALIRPFRHWIVYPALLRQTERTWDARMARQSS